MSQVIVPRQARSALLDYLSLFTSMGTLLCCALPSLLVLLGMGATVAGFLSATPWLVTLSRNKFWVFLLAGILIASNFIYTYALVPKLRRSGQECSIDAPGTCETASAISRTILWASAVIYAIGLCSAYLLGPLLMRFAA